MLAMTWEKAILPAFMPQDLVESTSQIQIVSSLPEPVHTMPKSLRILTDPFVETALGEFPLEQRTGGIGKNRPRSGPGY
jgi:hypothetical protein